MSCSTRYKHLLRDLNFFSGVVTPETQCPGQIKDNFFAAIKAVGAGAKLKKTTLLLPASWADDSEVAVNGFSVIDANGQPTGFAVYKRDKRTMWQFVHEKTGTKTSAIQPYFAARNEAVGYVILLSGIADFNKIDGTSVELPEDTQRSISHLMFDYRMMQQVKA